ncbi:MAG: hypothetical protein Harvfovirus30_1, partial [Harvfovirus sp.]
MSLVERTVEFCGNDRVPEMKIIILGLNVGDEKF